MNLWGLCLCTSLVTLACAIALNLTGWLYRENSRFSKDEPPYKFGTRLIQYSVLMYALTGMLILGAIFAGTFLPRFPNG